MNKDLKILGFETAFYVVFGFWIVSLDAGGMWSNLCLAFISLTLGLIKGRQIYEARTPKQ